MKQYVFFLEEAVTTEIKSKYSELDLKILYGSKAFHIGQMMNLSIPIPPGFLITSEACKYYLEYEAFPENLENQIYKFLNKIEEKLAAKFASSDNPLFLSVRSGSAVSMPGMMETILNLGFNDQAAEALIRKTQNPIFVYDSYVRFVYMYSTIALNMDKEGFLTIKKEFKEKNKMQEHEEFSLDQLKKILHLYKQHVATTLGSPFIEDPYQQLKKAIIAVFKSWNLDRALAYRNYHGISHDLGTGVSVIAMVFGNKGSQSGTGVLFTRNPSNGEKKVYGEWLKNAQGELLVSGEETPSSIDEMQKEFPQIYKQLIEIGYKLENHYREMQDIEFTVEQGKLWILQCRTGKRTTIAAFHIAYDMVLEGLINQEEAILRLDPIQLNQLLKNIFDYNDKKRAIQNGMLLGIGLNATPGNVSGRVVFSSEAVAEYAKKSNVILVRNETSPEDVKGMFLASGILTTKGGMTSHAALIARQLGKVAVVGFKDLVIDFENKKMFVHGKDTVIFEGDYISLDGNTGEVINGLIKEYPSEVGQVLIHKTIGKNESEFFKKYESIMNWAKDFKDLAILTNADQGDQIKEALAFGAEGIGLCRTEHMFFKGDRISLVQEMILTSNINERKFILNQLMDFQIKDFLEIVTLMGHEKPVRIRLIDPPLHEFLPKLENEISILAKKMNLEIPDLKKKIKQLEELNPMLGSRGCRLGILQPDVIEMQVFSIISAAFDVYLKSKKMPNVEIMIPFVSNVNEVKNQKTLIFNIYEKFLKEKSIKNFPFPFKIGVMIELPRAAIVADKIAQEVDFFSFGTNDLTQTTYGISRDDSNDFMPKYLEKSIFEADPFIKIDVDGVGFLISLAIEKAKKVNKNLSFSVCGEHASNPESIKFFHLLKMDSISCSPHQVPLAILTAAQNRLLAQKKI